MRDALGHGRVAVLGVILVGLSSPCYANGFFIPSITPGAITLTGFAGDDYSTSAIVSVSLISPGTPPDVVYIYTDVPWLQLPQYVPNFGDVEVQATITGMGPGAYVGHINVPGLQYPDAVCVVTLKISAFTDLPPDNWAWQEVQALFAAGIVQGYPDGTYRPERTVTRGQMAIYIARAFVTPSGDAAVPEPPAGTQTFPDVGPENVAYYKYVEYCAARNIVQGFWDGNYKLDKLANRGQMAMCIARALVQPGGDAAVPAATGGPTFPDVTATGDTALYFNHVEYLAGLGVVEGFWDGLYHPDRPVRRDQMAAYVARAFQLPM